VDKSKKVLDDLAILGLATINRGFVISSDRYKDHRNHKDLVNTIENHLVSFSMRRVTMDEIGGKDIMYILNNLVNYISEKLPK
jgi:thiazole synthase ThiGH ThiG subunit